VSSGWWKAITCNLPERVARKRGSATRTVPAHILSRFVSWAAKSPSSLDPRGVVHATSGILPAKAIHIPADQFSDALQNLEITFLSAPVLSDRGVISLPLPAEPGYAWSWLRKENGVWDNATEIRQPSAEATFTAPQELIEGWLKLTQVDEK
jgi:hypothetical protein